MKAKKSLGQNFLNSTLIINDIINASGTKKGDTVLEIGPGEGSLTKELLKTGAHVISVEKDDRLIPILKEKFSAEINIGSLKLIHGDILEINLSSLPIKKYKLVANIPYYITGLIIRKFLETNTQPESITLLVQKEVAERIVAKDKKESILSISVKVFGQPKYIKTVSKSNFKPSPKIDSAILHISNISYNKISKGKIQLFFDIIHAGFLHKRKLLISNLSEKYEKEKIDRAFSKLSIDKKIRAEDIGVETWVSLCNIISQQ